MSIESDEIAEKLGEVLMAPLAKVGDMLAREIDKANVEIAELEKQIIRLGYRIDALEEHVGP